VIAFGEFQDARVFRLDPGSSGAGALYRRATDGKHKTHSDRMRQLWIELKALDGLALRLGRQDLKLGTEVVYPEANWKYLKTKRAAERLVGTVGWTHGERSYDGATLAYPMDGHHLYLFGAKPTTGVFDINSAYSSQQDIVLGGLSWTVERGTWVRDTEIRFFGIGYEDERSARDGGGTPDEQREVWTAGVSAIGVYPLGRGDFDALFWGAVQYGDFNDLDHRAFAFALELGYQCHDSALKPWLRAGVNLASGDGSPSDGDQESFFNLLPTNHLYYGFADQLAFENLVDTFAQLMLKPAPKLGLNLMVHRFALYTSDDGRRAGTGAYNRNSFGYATQPSRGHRPVGYEFDVVASYQVHPKIGLQAGYAFLNGSGVLNSFVDEDVRFAYFQIAAKY
jgi:hypothetical protein